MLAVLPDRLQATVQAFLEGIPSVLKSTIRRVCMDMWDGYAEAVVAALPHAQIVVIAFMSRFSTAMRSTKSGNEECRRINASRAGGPCPWPNRGPLVRREWPSLTPDPAGQLVELFGTDSGLGECLCPAHDADRDL